MTDNLNNYFQLAEKIQPITSRLQATQTILAQKLKHQISWKQIAEVFNCSREWATAACLGQMKLSKTDAEALAKLLGFVL